jgi:hypothetical protein
MDIDIDDSYCNSSKENLKKVINGPIEKSRTNDMNEGLLTSTNRSANNTIDTSLLSSSSSLSPNLKSSSSSSNTSLNQQKQASFQPFGGTAAAAAAAEWYKQYEDRFFNRNPIFPNPAGLHNYLKQPVIPSLDRTSSRINSPNGQSLQSNSTHVNQQVQSSPVTNSNQTTPQSSDSSLLMERFYSNVPHALGASSPFTNMLLKPPISSATNNPNSSNEAEKLLAASHQAILAQYAQQFYLNGSQNSPVLPTQAHVGSNGFNHSRMAAAAAAAMAANYHLHSSSNNPESQQISEKERYLASLNYQNLPPFHPNPFNSFNSNNRSHSDSQQSQSQSNYNNINGTSQRIDDTHNSRNRNNSSGSRSPSPTSSQQSGNGCEEDEEDCEDSQSINAGNGEWTYEEQFKQVIILFFFQNY